MRGLFGVAFLYSIVLITEHVSTIISRNQSNSQNDRIDPADEYDFGVSRNKTSNMGKK